MTIDKYAVELGLNASSFTKGIKEATNNLGSLATAAKSAAAAFVGGKLFQSIATDFMKFNTSLGNSIQLMKYNVANTEAMGAVLEHFGGDVNSAVSSLNSLSSSLEAARWGSGALVEVSKKYGISFQKSNGQLMESEELLMSLANQMQSYDKHTRAAIASQLGLDESMTRALMMGGPALQEMIKKEKELKTTTEEDLKISREYQKSILHMKRAWGGVMQELSRGVLPAVTEFLKVATNIITYFKSNNLVIPMFFAGAGIASIKVVRRMGSMLTIGKSILGVSKGITGSTLGMFKHIATIVPMMKGMNFNLTSILKGAGSLMKIFKSPIFIFTIIALVLQDIIYYMKGWKSLIGDILEHNPKLLEFFKSLWSLLEPILKLIPGVLKAFTGDFSGIKEAGSQIFGVGKQDFKDEWQGLKSMVGMGAPETAAQKAARERRQLEAQKSLYNSPYMNTIGYFQKKLLMPGPENIFGFGKDRFKALEAPRMSGGGGATTINQTNNVTVNAPSSDPKAVATATAAALSDSINKISATIGK